MGHPIIFHVDICIPIIHNSFQCYKSIIFIDFDFWILDSLVLFYFPLSIFFFIFSYLRDNYRTLLITVLFIRTDRLSCMNIRVIIIIIIIITIIIDDRKTKKQL